LFIESSSFNEKLLMTYFALCCSARLQCVAVCEIKEENGIEKRERKRERERERTEKKKQRKRMKEREREGERGRERERERERERDQFEQCVFH